MLCTDKQCSRQKCSLYYMYKRSNKLVFSASPSWVAWKEYRSTRTWYSMLCSESLGSTDFYSAVVPVPNEIHISSCDWGIAHFLSLYYYVEQHTHCTRTTLIECSSYHISELSTTYLVHWYIRP